jgi:DMSO/TMAO reductase YedYZ molybdopterin-dependent catalytic subunit
MRLLFLITISSFFCIGLSGENVVISQQDNSTPSNSESLLETPIKSRELQNTIRQFCLRLQNTDHDANMPPLEVIKQVPYNAETPERALVSRITPIPNAYVRTNFGVPTLSDDHVIEVGGAVKKPLKLSISDLRKMPQRTITATMECAGNDRLAMRPFPEGEPWNTGALSTMTWTGVPLATVLEMAGVSSDAIEVLTTAADTGLRDDAEGEVRYARALPLTDALRDDTLLALSMNGEPLTPDHGAPLRLVVPGWYGMASVKWITRIDLITEPFEGYFQKQRYVYENTSGNTPVDRIRVKSIITQPANGAKTSRTVDISGWAWSGFGAITRVEVKVDGESTWHEAKIGTSDSSHAWSPWSLTIPLPESGRFVLSTRATDASGAIQPNEIVWNRLGYGNNAIRYSLIEAE